MESGGQDTSRLELRLPARSSQSPLLRAQLRLWLLANRADGDDRDVFDILAAATRVFLLALWRPGPVRTIAVDVEATCTDGVVEVALHDHAGPRGNTLRFQHVLTPAPRLAARSMAQPTVTP